MIDASRMQTDEVQRVRLAGLVAEHRDLDAAIGALHEAPAADQLTLKRLKKRKLALKDEIETLRDRLTPDIIA